jgi:hypothetical protein
MISVYKRVDLPTRLAERDARNGRAKRRQYMDFYIPEDDCCILCDIKVSEHNRHAHEAGKRHVRTYAVYKSSYDIAVVYPDIAERDAVIGIAKRSLFEVFYADGWCSLCDRQIRETQQLSHEDGKWHGNRYYSYYISHYDAAVRRLPKHLLLLACIKHVLVAEHGSLHQARAVHHATYHHSSAMRTVIRCSGGPGELIVRLVSPFLMDD